MVCARWERVVVPASAWSTATLMSEESHDDCTDQLFTTHFDQNCHRRRVLGVECRKATFSALFASVVTVESQHKVGGRL
jgi:hypothetical protein